MNNEMLRHTVATLAYRGGKALRGAPAEFANYRPAADARSAGEILAHLCDLFTWALGMANGKSEWNLSQVSGWDEGCARFYAGLEAFDARLAADEPLGTPAEKLFQGPVADAFTHVGQIAMMRRLAGAPVRGENYFVAKIEVGRVGADQPAPVREFD